MANVSFKKGSSSALQTIKTSKTAVPGAFYLTTDTNRLYFGKDDNSLADLNKYILTVSSLTEAQQLSNLESGDFVYIAEDNILAIYYDNGNGSKWVQINPDTNIDTHISKIEAEATGKADTHEIEITLKIYETIKNVADNGETPIQTPKEVTFAITASDMLAANNVSVGMGVKGTSDEEAIIQVEGDGVKEDEGASVKLIGGKNVTVSSDQDEDIITITAQDTQYDIGVANNVLTFTPKNTSNAAGASITYAGDDAIGIETSNNTLTFTHKNFSPLTEPTPIEETPEHEESITLLSAIELDKGHVTNYTPISLKLPSDKNSTYAAESITADDQGKLTFKIIGQNGGADSSQTSGQVLYYTIGDHINDKYYNQSSLPVYTKNEIDDKMRGIDAMVYRGILDSAATDENILKDVPTSNVKIGDTYKVATAGEYGSSISCLVGDLLIASGTEDKDGYITASTIVWNRVPAGDDIDTKYELFLRDTSLVLSEDPGNKESVIYFTTTDENDDIVLEAGANNQLSIAHKGYTITPPSNVILPDNGELGYGEEFSIISSITANNGHITEYKVTNLKLPQSDSVISELTASKVADNDVKLTLSESGGNAHGKVTEVEIVGGKDIVVGYDNTITIDHNTINTTDNKADVNKAGAEPEGLDYGDVITVLTDATVDNGHVTNYQYTKYALPALDNTQYFISNSVTTIEDGVQIENKLNEQGSSSGTDSSAKINITSSSLEITSTAVAVGEAEKVSIELEWGTFEENLDAIN